MLITVTAPLLGSLYDEPGMITSLPLNGLASSSLLFLVSTPSDESFFFLELRASSISAIYLKAVTLLRSILKTALTGFFAF